MASDSKATPEPSITITKSELESMVAKAVANATVAPQNSNTELANAVMRLADERARTTRTSNAWHPGISPFSHPEGEIAHPKGKLDRETWFCSCKQEESQLTPAEIDLFNAIQISKVWRGDPKFGADVSAKRRFIMLPHVSIDERMQLPGSLSMILMELISGEDAVDPLKMADEMLALRKQVRELVALSQQSPSAP